MPNELVSRARLAMGLAAVCLGGPVAAADDWLRWPAPTAEAVGKAMRQQGRVGGYFDLRVTGTSKSYNFKIRATWLTPDVIRAGARLLQLQEGLSDEEARKLVASAEGAADTVILVELDPREGSGVIPLGWTAHLQPKDRPQAPAVKGSLMPRLRDVPVLKGVDKRDYAYDVFWVGFPLARDGVTVFGPEDREAELVVRIEGKEGRVTWTIPPSIRALGSASVTKVAK